jgi:hypothetical protein
MNEEIRDFEAPLGAVTTGRLVIARGASRLHLHAGDPGDRLFRAHFEGPVPDVRVAGGTVTVTYHFSLADWARYAIMAGYHAADVALDPSIPWDIEIRGGLSRVEMDLRDVPVRSLTVGGGASQVDIALPTPSGTVPVRVTGGASKVEIRRPAGVPARLQVGGGASKLQFDRQLFGAIGGATTLHSPEFEKAGDRYRVEIGGGVSQFSVLGV